MQDSKTVWIPKVLQKAQKNTCIASGYQPIIVQPVAYAPVFDPNEIGSQIRNANTWLFTSERAIKYLKPWLTAIPNKSERLVFTVGERSTSALESLGYTIAGKAPDARGLLVKLQALSGTIAYFCNADRGQVIPDFFAHNPRYTEVPIYKGEQQHNLPELLPNVWLALSPLTIQAMLECKPELAQIPVVSIGPTTTAALERLGIHPVATCPAPSLEMCFYELSKLKQHGIEK
jgi:uroporphyrinogen-III synthase